MINTLGFFQLQHAHAFPSTDIDMQTALRSGEEHGAALLGSTTMPASGPYLALPAAPVRIVHMEGHSLPVSLLLRAS